MYPLRFNDGRSSHRGWGKRAGILLLMPVSLSLKPIARFLAFSFAACIVSSGEAALAADLIIDCKFIPKLREAFLESHVLQPTLTDELRREAGARFLVGLDPVRVSLTDSTVQGLLDGIVQMDSEVKRSDCSALERAQEAVVSGARKLQVLAKRRLAEVDFRIDEAAVVNLDPASATWPKDGAEQEERFAAHLQFRAALFQVAERSDEIFALSLVDHYERWVKDIEQISEVELVARYLKAFAEALDARSDFFSRADLAEFREAMEPDQAGLGMAIRKAGGLLLVTQVLRGGSAERQSAIQPGDFLIALSEGKDGPALFFIDRDLRGATKRLRGKDGSEVELLGLRVGAKPEIFIQSLTRTISDLEREGATIRRVKREREGRTFELAVLSLNSFYGEGTRGEQESAKDVRRLLRSARADRVDGLLLELSENGGGLLQSGIEIAGEFISEGPVVVVRETGKEPEIHEDKRKGVEYAGPLVVLTSKESAATSEIVAGALQDHDRAIVVGDARTFGSGSVHNVMILPEGSGALQVTMGLYYLLRGASPSGVGIAPDVVVPSLTQTSSGPRQAALPDLPPVPIDPKQAGAGKKWRPISDEDRRELVARSAQRVSASSAYSEAIRKHDADEVGARRVALGELLRAASANPAEPAGEGAAFQLDEALEVLADLVEISE